RQLNLFGSGLVPGAFSPDIQDFDMRPTFLRFLRSRQRRHVSRLLYYLRAVGRDVRISRLSISCSEANIRLLDGSRFDLRRFVQQLRFFLLELSCHRLSLLGHLWWINLSALSLVDDFHFPGSCLRFDLGQLSLQVGNGLAPSVHLARQLLDQLRLGRGSLLCSQRLWSVGSGPFRLQQQRRHVARRGYRQHGPCCG